MYKQCPGGASRTTGRRWFLDGTCLYVCSCAALRFMAEIDTEHCIFSSGSVSISVIFSWSWPCRDPRSPASRAQSYFHGHGRVDLKSWPAHGRLIAGRGCTQATSSHLLHVHSSCTLLLPKVQVSARPQQLSASACRVSAADCGLCREYIYKQNVMSGGAQ